MSDVQVVETPTQTPPPTPEAPAPAVSIDDHAAQFSPEALKDAPPETKETPQQARDREGRFTKERHRAQSQKASPGDYGRIAELTKRLRETEKERDEWKSKHATPPPAPVDTPKVAETPAPKDETPKSEFAKPKPTLQSLITEGVDDPYAELADRVYAWNEERKAFEAESKKTSESAAQQRAKVAERVKAFAAEHPDYDDVIEKSGMAQMAVPPALKLAIDTDDNPAAIVYHLAQHPDEFSGLLLQTFNLDPNPQVVALLRRRLSTLVQAAGTGSVAQPQAVVLAPKPPNPVRTGPIRTDEGPPEQAASIAEHAKYHAPKGRR